VLVCWDLGLNRLPSCGVPWGSCQFWEVPMFLGGKIGKRLLILPALSNQVMSQGGVIEIVYRGV
jgi:hypothetical protein